MPNDMRTVRGSLSPLPNRCNALVKSNEDDEPERYCQSYPIGNRERCYFHGGQQRRGEDNPLFKGRGYTRDMPERILHRFAEAMEDPELGGLASEIALLDARIGEVLAKMPAHESLVGWAIMGSGLGTLNSALSHLLAALPEDDPSRQDMELALETMTEALTDANAEYRAWENIESLIQQRRRVVDTERKRESELKANMTYKEVLVFIAQLQTALVEEISDKELLQRIGRRIRRVLHFKARSRLLPQEVRMREQEEDDEVIIEEAEVIDA